VNNIAVISSRPFPLSVGYVYILQAVYYLLRWIKAISTRQYEADGTVSQVNGQLFKLYKENFKPL